MTSQRHASHFPALDTIIGDAAWLAHRYDPGADAVHLVHVPRIVHRTATFLTDANLPSDVVPVVVPRSTALAAAPVAAPAHFIFHSAFCCSTLLARAFDHPGWSMGLSEPVILNDVIGWRRRAEQGPDMAEVLDSLLTLLARPFAPGEAVVTKPSTAINALAPAILALRPTAHALLLYAPLPTFLGSVAKKGLEGRLWVRTLLTGMLDDGLAQFGYSARELLGKTDLQIAALCWLGQQALFADLVARYGPGRVATLDSEALLANPAKMMAALARHFGLACTDRLIDKIVAGPAFTRHSKLGTAFDTVAREAEHRDAATMHAEEIGVVLQWAERVAETFGIALNAPAPLVG